MSPQTHREGISLLFQSYLRWIASRNSLLLSVKFMSLAGITVSQWEITFSAASSAALLVLRGRAFFTSFRLSGRHCSFFWGWVCCRFPISSSSGSSCDCATICSTRGVVIVTEAYNSYEASRQGFFSTSPPSRTGSANKSRSLGAHSCPVVAGIRV